MASFRRRWQSIDRKLPIVASGLVVLTAAVLCTAAYVLLERALFDAAGRRLFATAKVVAQVAGRPSARIGDSTNRAADVTLREYLRGRGSTSEVHRALSIVASGPDTTKYYAALLNASGHTVLTFSRPGTVAPRWIGEAIRRGEIRGDTASLGPFEN